MGLVVGCQACQGSAPPKAPVREVAADIADIEGKNLSAEEELGALLKGKASLGRGRGSHRVAVPPFQLHARPEVMRERQYLGGSVAELFASRLTHTEGVSVLERSELTKIIEELRRGGEVSSAGAQKLAATGRLVGAEYLVLGGLHERDLTHFHAVIRPVRVEDAVVLPTVEFDLDASATGGPELDAAVAKILDKVGVVGASPPPAKPLAPAALALATRARELQYQGDLVKAQPLYAKALAEPSDQYRFEAEYIRLMLDLGMTEWALSRTSQVLSRMPASAAAACDRAAVTTQRARAINIAEGPAALGDAREAVRLAATCGDPVILGGALVVYASAVDSVHYPSRAAALAHAKRLAEGKSAWLSCWVDGNVAFDSDARLASAGSELDAAYTKIAERCEASGNLRVAAVHAGNAAYSTPVPSRRTELFARAAKLAERVGGSTLDTQLFAVADDLRGAGKPSEADARLLSVVESHLSSILQLTGALVEPESRLDDELLRAAKVSKPTVAARTVSEDEKLVLAAHRKGLAAGLRKWADRTRGESRQQADYYVAIADVLNPPREPTLTDKRAAITQRLERAKLPYEAVLAATAPPLRGSGANLQSAFWALTELYWLTVEGSEDKAREVLGAARKVAEWTQSPDLLREIAKFEARLYLRAKNPGAAKERLRAAAAFVKDSPGQTDALLDLEVEAAAQNPKAIAELRAKQVDFARKGAPARYAWTVYMAEDAAWKAGRDFGEGVARLVKLSQELDGQGAFEASATALERAARLYDDGTHTDGSTEHVRLALRRVTVLDKAGDPLRSLDSRVDLLWAIRGMLWHTYRGSTNEMMAKNPVAAQHMRDVRGRLDALVASGRLRDAARAVGRLPPGTPGAQEVIRAALGWAASFKDSAEFPMLAALLHRSAASETKDPAERKRELGLARDLFVEAKSTTEAAFAERQLMERADSETELWALADACWGLAGSSARDRAECVMGIGAYLIRGARSYADKERVRSAIARGREVLPEFDPASGITERYRLRTHIGVLAAEVGDVPTFDRMLEDIRDYYVRQQPDAYQFVSYQASFASSAARFDPKRSVALWREFDAAHGASDYWRSFEYPGVAKTARLAHDVEAERYFLEAGRAAAQRAPAQAYRYDLYAARLATEAKDWRASGAAYKAMAATVERMSPRSTVVHALALSDAAVALGLARDWAAADKLLAPHAKVWMKALTDGARLEAPCTRARALDLAAAVDMKLAQCAEGKLKREAAGRARALCTADYDDGAWTEGPKFATLHFENACAKAPELSVQNLLSGTP